MNTEEWIKRIDEWNVTEEDKEFFKNFILTHRYSEKGLIQFEKQLEERNASARIGSDDILGDWYSGNTAH